MWRAAVFAGVGVFFYRHIKRKADIAKEVGAADMLGFHWGDSVDTVAKWTKKLGLRYQNSDNNSACIVYTGKFPELMQPVSYTFHMPGGALDSIAVLAEDATGISYGILREKFLIKYGEPWDEEPGDNVTWITGHSDEILFVMLQGKSGYLHMRFFNLENLDDNDLDKLDKLDEEHDRVIDMIRLIDAEITRQNEARRKK